MNLNMSLEQEAVLKELAARKAHSEGDVKLRNQFLNQAMDRWKVLGRSSRVEWCKKFKAK